ncbi:snare-like protein, partial [Heliocybe sulcata]
RHCNIVYYQDWHRTKRPKPAGEGGGILPAVAHSISPQTHYADPSVQSAFASPRNTLSSTSGVVIAVNNEPASPLPGLLQMPAPQQQATPPQPMSELPFDEEAKLVYGVILSLRNMIKKLSGRDEQFVNYRTSTYKLHLYETLSGYRFVMLSDHNTDSLRFVLRQIYTGPFLEYVVRNPLVTMDSRERGIDNEYFRASTDRLIRGLSVFP